MKKTFLKIAIVGKPNVGKSTLFNAIFNQKQMIVNQKPQTTRKPLSLTYETDKYVFEFVDTPGYHNIKNKLDGFLNNYVLNAFKSIDLVFLLSDSSRMFSDEDEKLINKLISNKINVFLIHTKSDLNKNECIIPQNLKDNLKIVKEFNISASNKILDNLLEETMKYANEHGELIPVEMIAIKEEDDKFLISEIIREECLNLLNNEIPYGVAIGIEKMNYDKEKNLFNIDAFIAVEKENHKAIVIGAKGKMIKEIGTRSRIQLLNIFDCNINLQLFVKVDKDWRNNLTKIKEYGYFN